MKASKSRSFVERRIAKIPPTLPTVLGPVAVTWVKDLRDNKGQECFGIWRNSERDVRLDDAQHPAQAWQTYWHEWAHAVMWDAGIRVKSELAERICDAFGLARALESIGPDGECPK